MNTRFKPATRPFTFEDTIRPGFVNMAIDGLLRVDVSIRTVTNLLIQRIHCWTRCRSVVYICNNGRSIQREFLLQRHPTDDLQDAVFHDRIIGRMHVLFRDNRLSVSVCDLSRIPKQVDRSPCVALVFRPVCSNQLDNTIIECPILERITSTIQNLDELGRVIIEMNWMRIDASN